ncbi:MAG: hypothetical protein ABIP55_05610 [Tepidisphaeraceae bacterium]
MKPIPTATIASCLLILSALAGCTRTVNVKTWQKDVETYVRETGRGDPGVLRDVTISGERRGFAVIGKDHPRQSTDANGLLLAHKTISDRPWFIYLVGVVNEQQVKEIRLAALSIVHGDATWRIGPKDKDALARYRASGLARWKQQSPAQQKPPGEYTTFPRPADAFDVNLAGTGVQATHNESGARWEVNLAAPRH